MKNYYCLITSDTKIKYATDIINSRLKEKKFPLYKRTPFLNEIKKNDEVVFYLAGTGENSQSFVASAKISCVEIFNKTEVTDPDNNNQIVIKYLNLNNIKFFKKVVFDPIQLSLIVPAKVHNNFLLYLCGSLFYLD